MEGERKGKLGEREIQKQRWRERKGEDKTNPSGREETERVYDSPA